MSVVLIALAQAKSLLVSLLWKCPLREVANGEEIESCSQLHYLLILAAVLLIVLWLAWRHILHPQSALMITYKLVRSRYVIHKEMLSWIEDTSSDNITEHIPFRAIGLNGTLVRNISLVRHVMQFPTFRKTRTEYFFALLGHGTGTANELHSWKDKRRALDSFYAHCKFSSKALHSSFQKTLQTFSGKTVNVIDLIAPYTLRLALTSILGYEGDFPESLAQDIKCAKLFSLFIGPLFSFIPSIFTPTPRSIQRIDSFARHVYQTVRESNSSRNLLVEQLISNGFESDSILDEIKGVVFPAVEQAVPISFILFELAKRPDIQDQLHQDIQMAVQENHGDFNVTQIAEKLPLVKAIVNEGLRMYPLYPILARKNHISDTHFKSVFISQQKDLFCCPYVIGRDPLRFEQPHIFNPTRLSPLSSTGAFGFSNRSCPAKQYVLKEISDLIVLIVYEWRMKCDPSANPQTQAIITLESDKPIEIAFEPRK